MQLLKKVQICHFRITGLMAQIYNCELLCHFQRNLKSISGLHLHQQHLAFRKMKDIKYWQRNLDVRIVVLRNLEEKLRNIVQDLQKNVGEKQILYYKLLPEYEEKIKEAIYDERVVDFEEMM